MKLKTEDYRFSLLTPAMIGGALLGKGSNAEMRVASIRGQVRAWHRRAGLVPSPEVVWGKTDGGTLASKVGLSLLPGPQPTQTDAVILPHKGGTTRKAIPMGESFTLRLTRLVDCGNSHWETAKKAVKLWLLLGGLGLRVNRAAGSVWPLDSPGEEPWVPADEAGLKSLLLSLGYDKPVGLADAAILRHRDLAREPSDALKLRRAASDTVSDRKYFGGIDPRKLSPLKMKVVRFGGHDYRILLTGLSASDLIGARASLGASKALGSVEWRCL